MSTALRSLTELAEDVCCFSLACHFTDIQIAQEQMVLFMGAFVSKCGCSGFVFVILSLKTSRHYAITSNSMMEICC